MHIGRIASQLATSSSKLTLSSESIRRLNVGITIFSIFSGIILFSVGFGIGNSIISNLVFGIGILVACVPEGLPISLIIGQAIAARRLRRNGINVKNNANIDKIGSVTCIITDKTGILTQNNLKTSHLWYNGNMVDVNRNDK
jgi:sodium/potassium-transporting ATPase subunit alpha